MKTKRNYCTNCEESVNFPKGKCENCGFNYDDVVPASYRMDFTFDDEV